MTETVELLSYYKDMLTIRRFEEKAGQLYGMGLISGFCHLYIGQEAIAVGCANAISEDDYQITSYRCHAHTILSGVEPKYVMAELLGRKTGCSKGKGGSMHMFNVKGKFFGGHGIVGAQVSLGTGIAFACKYRKNKSVCLTYFGDGAVHQGQVYESFNMAALWKLPVIYIIENNQYSMGTSLARHSSSAHLYKRGESFGIPGKEIDGMDVLAVKDGVKEALEYVKSGNGPILLEIKTYRYRGHSMSDPAAYRSKEEVNEYKELHDPIHNLKQYILEQKLAKESDFTAIDKDVKELINSAAEFAKESPIPDDSDLLKDIYS